MQDPHLRPFTPRTGDAVNESAKGDQSRPLILGADAPCCTPSPLCGSWDFHVAFQRAALLQVGEGEAVLESFLFSSSNQFSIVESLVGSARVGRHRSFDGGLLAWPAMLAGSSYGRGGGDPDTFLLYAIPFWARLI